MTANALPGWIRYDAASDTLIIYGQRYNAGAFGQLGFGAIGSVFRIVKRDGSLMLETMNDGPTPTPAATPARDYRRELWVEVCARAAGANDCKSPSVATTWANYALARYDDAFPKGQN